MVAWNSLCNPGWALSHRGPSVSAFQIPHTHLVLYFQPLYMAKDKEN